MRYTMLLAVLLAVMMISTVAYAEEQQYDGVAGNQPVLTLTSDGSGNTTTTLTDEQVATVKAAAAEAEAKAKAEAAANVTVNNNIKVVNPTKIVKQTVTRYRTHTHVPVAAKPAAPTTAKAEAKVILIGGLPADMRGNANNASSADTAEKGDGHMSPIAIFLLSLLTLALILGAVFGLIALANTFKIEWRKMDDTAEDRRDRRDARDATERQRITDAAAERQRRADEKAEADARKAEIAKNMLDALHKASENGLVENAARIDGVGSISNRTDNRGNGARNQQDAGGGNNTNVQVVGVLAQALLDAGARHQNAPERDINIDIDVDGAGRPRNQQ